MTLNLDFPLMKQTQLAMVSIKRVSDTSCSTSQSVTNSGVPSARQFSSCERISWNTRPTDIQVKTFFFENMDKWPQWEGLTVYGNTKKEKNYIYFIIKVKTFNIFIQWSTTFTFNSLSPGKTNISFNMLFFVVVFFAEIFQKLKIY